MNRNIASSLAFAATVAAAGILSSKAYADDITIDKTSFVGARSRAEVRAELMSQPVLARAASDEWTSQHNQVPELNSTDTSEQVQSEYKMFRDEVSALTGEDSGAAYFKRTPARNTRTVMGAPGVDFHIDP